MNGQQRSRGRRFTQAEFDAAVAPVVEERNRLRYENGRLQAALDQVIADAERLCAVVGTEFGEVSMPVLASARVHLRLVKEATSPTSTQRGKP